MASIPPQRPQRQQSSTPQAASNEEHSSDERNTSESPSGKSLDSQTIFLNDPSSSSSKESNEASTRPTLERIPTADLRKCWICFSDETEDTPNNHSTWKTPCPCALTAHEACLLDWIADMEAPEGNRSAAQRKEIKCPQCKADIHLARPRSLVVDAMGVVEKVTGQTLLPGVVLGSVYTLFIGCSHHGAHTVRMIFGSVDADAILAPTPQVSLIEEQLQRYAPILARPFFRNWRGWRVELGLPMIPGALIASRTTFADTILPFLPIVFFATHPRHQQELTRAFWPPSAALAFVVLPYIRSLYEECLERIWGEHERRWTKEIRPRLGGEEENGGDNAQNNDADGNDGDLVQLQIDIEEEVEDDDEDGGDEEGAPAPPNVEQAGAPPLNQAPVDNEQQGGQANGQGDNEANPNQGQGQGNQNQHQHQHHRVDINFLAYASRFAETTLGALAFPTVSAAMGESLKFVLPPAWTVPRTRWGRPVPTGLLQTRWGRSIVGGCLFVAFKDAVRIYCKWKMAQAYRKRRVLDYDKRSGKILY